MRLQHIGFAAVVAVAAWLAGPGSARASAIIDATFTGAGGTPGTVSLEIDLPNNANNNTTAATAVYITSATIPLPGPTPYNVIGAVFSNSFTLTNRVLTGYDFGSQLVQARKTVYGLVFTALATSFRHSGVLFKTVIPRCLS